MRTHKLGKEIQIMDQEPQNAEADYALGAKWLLLRVTGGNLREPQENWLLEANKGKTY